MNKPLHRSELELAALDDLVAEGPAPEGPAVEPEPDPVKPEPEGPTVEPAPEPEPAPDPPAKFWLGAHLDDAVAMWDRRARGIDKPIPTVLAGLNSQLGGGLWGGEVVMLTGSTGSGKSQFALATAVDAAKAGTPVVYVGLELGYPDMVARVLGHLSDRRWSDLFRGRDALFPTVPDDDARSMDWARPKAVEVSERTRRAMAELRGLPLHLVVGTAHGWSPDRIADAVRDVRRYCPGPAPLVVLDYLQLVGSDNARDDVRARVSKASTTCRMVARDQGAAVLVISSIPRSAESTAGGAKESKIDFPTPVDMPGDRVGLGKESGEIEYSADVVLNISKANWDGNARWGLRALHAFAVAKNRCGPVGWAFGYFTGTGWVDAPDGAPAQTPKKPKKPKKPKGDANRNGKSPDNDGEKVEL